MLQDLRYAVRYLTKKPGFTAVAVLTLALGIGANTAIFSLVDAVLLSRLPFPDADRVVTVWETRLPALEGTNVVSPSNFLDWRSQCTSFSALAAYYDQNVTYQGPLGAQDIRAGITSPELFQVLGAPAAAGRLLTAEDGDDVVVLSHAFWNREFAADAGIVGQMITVGGQPHRVLGVAPPSVGLLIDGIDLWNSTDFAWADRTKQGRFLLTVARLRPDVDLESARAEMSTVAARLAEAYPEYNTGWSTFVTPLREYLVGETRPALLVLLGAVGFLLLIACANVSTLLLARAAGRRRELAVRASLGASRRRVLQQLLTESLLLAALGALGGILLASWTVDALLALLPDAQALPAISTVAIDWQALAFTFGLALVTSLLFGLVPAREAMRLDLVESLGQGRGTIISPRHQRFRNGLVVAQVALALLLLTGGGLMLRSFVELQKVKPGFDSENVTTARLRINRQRYDTPTAQAAFYGQVTAQLEAQPGIETVGATQFLPMSGLRSATSYYPEDRPRPAPGEAATTAVRVASDHYFRSLGIRLRDGRGFDTRDRENSPPVAVVNQTLAERTWPGQNPIGKSLRYWWGDWEAVEVVGVVEDVYHRGLSQEAGPGMYRPHSQLGGSMLYLTIKSSLSTESVAAALRQAVESLDATVPVAVIRPLEELVAGSAARTRFQMLLLVLFAGVALLLAAVGLYGVTAQAVHQRTPEIGVRMALGARRGEMLRSILGNGLRLSLTGVVIGLLAALLLTRWMSALLFGVSAVDPLTLLAAGGLLALVAAVASYLPARRAANIDPVVALRSA